jgi:ABC-type multidrug transport system ATPase subunit
MIYQAKQDLTTQESGCDPAGLVVKVEAIAKRYGKVTALDGVSFVMEAGESLALWGPNGAGKSTLIKTILGLIDYQGQIQINGQDTLRNGKNARRQVGYVPQEAIFYDMPLLSTMAFYGRLHKADPERIPHLVDKLDLSEHTRKRVSELSGGLKQRLALALALLSDPPLLLLDEPTANLDAQSRRDYLSLLVGLRKECKTILFASHRLEEVEILASRVLVMRAGKITDDLTPARLRRSLSPLAELTLWIPEEQRQGALSLFSKQGLKGHLNGRGTVVVQVATDQKVAILEQLSDQGISVLDFEIDQGEPWS